MRARMPLRIAQGEGVILDGGGTPFNDRWPGPHARRGRATGSRRIAPRGRGSTVGDDVARRRSAGRARRRRLRPPHLPVRPVGIGQELLARPDARAAAARDRLRIIVIDPNSDCVRLPELRDDADPDPAHAGANSPARSSSAPGVPKATRASALRFGELERQAQAALLRLDPIADRDEYAEFAALLEDARPNSSPIWRRRAARGERLRDADCQSRRRPLGHLGARRTRAACSTRSTIRRCGCSSPTSARSTTREEQALVAESVLGHLWERRTRREPVLLVIDEAHNVCPREPGDALTALATEHAVRIAGEGRKFGIYMLVASQRPAKVHENVLSQCDNLVLMRLNSAADAELIADLYGFVPPALISLATDFRLGEALVAGKLASHPTIMRFGARVAREGGADVAADWAAARDRTSQSAEA